MDYLKPTLVTAAAMVARLEDGKLFYVIEADAAPRPGRGSRSRSCSWFQLHILLFLVCAALSWLKIFGAFPATNGTTTVVVLQYYYVVTEAVFFLENFELNRRASRRDIILWKVMIRTI